MLNDKMKVLGELCLVRDDNKGEVYRYLAGEIANHPGKDTRSVLDRAARELITGRIVI